MDHETKYEKAKAERSSNVEKIVLSTSARKVVVAGPGTGKTFLFKQVLQAKRTTLTLTFVNSLVEDLSLELYGISEVKTLHSFARSLLKTLWKKNINIFPKLSAVIEKDARTLLGQQVDFAKIFHERDDANPHIEFYRKRKKYYDNTYGYSDVIYAAVKYLEAHPDAVPRYEQIVVDEFQDFNLLEVSLIELLATKSPILLAGDDDQALYDFKSASTKHIRERHNDATHGYESFNLPLCSRCTRVIVGATNDIVEQAEKNGLLSGRIKKPYRYFTDQDKDRVSDANPQIEWGHSFPKQLGWFIANELEGIAREVKGMFSVLVISPIRMQARQLANALRSRGLHVEYSEGDAGKEPVLLDGLKLVLEDSKSNLGWRIIAEALMNQKDFDGLLAESERPSAKSVFDLVDSGCKRKVRIMLGVLRKIRDSKPLDAEDIDVLKEIRVEPYDIVREHLAGEFPPTRKGKTDPGIKKIPVMVTTVQSAKGLCADYVFIAHCDDRFFIGKNGLTDRAVCNFLVALTRARKKVFLVSTQKKKPTFVQWIQAQRVSGLEVGQDSEEIAEAVLELVD